MRFAFLIFFSIALMVVDHRLHYFDSVRTALSVSVYPIQYMVNFPVSAGNWVGDNLTSRDQLLAENEKLKSRNAFLQAQMQKYVSLEIENMRLRRLLDASERLTDRVLTAELLAVDLDPFSHQVMINKGSRHDVYIGQPVLDANGVYGQIVKVTPLNSTIVLITDPGHALPVQVNRSGLRTIAQGTGVVDKLDLLHIPNNGDIKEGDTLVTSGLGGVFPAGYPVAVVVKVVPDSSKPFAKVTAKPLAELDKSREVLLVWKEKS
ncbi:MAG: rod shape-determining protein MreC, partial [Gammaproteobacteria bacterium]|nr:rod shape-determining protein MreC [Gammaproteobacteria bacterium]